MSPATASDGAWSGSAEAPAETPSVWLARVRLSSFRSYAEAELETDGRPVVLTGANGAGKTNLLEAISYLVPGRGLRGARLSEVDRRLPEAEAVGGKGAGHSSGPWAVAAEVMTPEGPRQLGTGRDPAASGRERRLVKVDGSLVSSQQALGDVLGAVWLTPQMDRLFLEGAPGRRRFLDRLVLTFDPAHAGRITAYEQALRERARILRGDNGPADPDWLTALEETMAERGIAIAAARRDLVGRLAAACAEAEGAFPKAGLGLAGDLESWLAEAPALEAEDRFKAALAAGRRQDAETGGAALGPHRSDLAVRHLARRMPAAQCSTGEQKALLISIILAHARLVTLQRGQAPLLLLDEIVAHLDAERRAALFEALLSLGAQAWLTGTDGGLFEDLGTAALFVTVRDSRLTR
ncbi:MAG: DNA replication/repair protein RecF [Kiloniellales bacterium]|nr:DNA replication/repair protein RecF [Kiloniellales bacterium]